MVPDDGPSGAQIGTSTLCRMGIRHAAPPADRFLGAWLQLGIAPGVWMHTEARSWGLCRLLPESFPHRGHPHDCH